MAKVIGISLGFLLAYAVTKGMHHGFDLHTWLASLASVRSAKH